MPPASRVLAVGLLLASAAAPPALAASATHQETLVPLLAGHDVASSHAYALDLGAGETLEAHLQWQGPNAPRADLDLALAAPGDVCSAAPETDPGCLAAEAEAEATQATCQGPGDPGASDGLGPGDETAAATAGDDEAGTWSVYVVASLAVPGDPVRYTLDLETTGDGADAVDGPQETILVRTDGHCHHEPSTDPLP